MIHYSINDQIVAERKQLQLGKYDELCSIPAIKIFWLRYIHTICDIIDKWKLCENEQVLTDDAWVSGPVRAPQKFLLSQKFGPLMGWRNMEKKIFLSCLVFEIQLFVYIFGWISKWPPEVRKGSLVKFFEVSYYQNFF